MRLLACGFNAHGQLMIGNSKSEMTDRSSFVHVLEAFHIRILFAGWSRTLVVTQSSPEGEHTLLLSQLDESSKGWVKLNSDIPHPINCVYGNHDGPLGLVSRGGELYLMLENEHNADEKYNLENISSDDSPKICQIAINGAGKVCATPAPAPGATVAHLLEFECFGTVKRKVGFGSIEPPPEKGSFLSWFLDPTNPNHRPTRHHMLPGPCKRLVANMVTFSMLNDGGELFTWGDGRYPAAFGRPISKDSPAKKPCLASAVNYMAIKATSVATGGTVTAAKTNHRAFALIWGTSTLGEPLKQVISTLKEQAAGQASLIQLGSASFPAAISSIAVGNGHVLAVDDKGDLWAAGRNNHGQLGLGQESRAFVREWKKVELELFPWEHISKVVCGDLTSFLIIKDKPDDNKKGE